MAAVERPKRRAVTHALAIGILIILAVASTACGDDAGEDSRTTTPVVSTATVAPGPNSTPTAVLSGAEAAAQALSLGDASEIWRAIDWFQLPCGVPDAGVPPCPDGVAGGTPVSVSASLLTCSLSGGAYMFEDSPADLADRFLNDRLALSDGYRVVATAGASDALDLARFAPGLMSYLILESRSSPGRGLIAGLSDRGIRLLSTSCGASASEMIRDHEWPSLATVDSP
jgi:hypothetical protein